MTANLLQAGALLPITQKKDSAGDPVSARVYKHEALGGRVVVKLVADNLAPAEDLSLEYLGFSLAEVRGPVARGRRQAVGFPAWALINDPKNGGYALEVVKEMEKIARVARSKPGNAKDQYEGVAGRLAKTVPHFLPTFFEEAGRGFIESGNNAQAATMFAKARDAERVYNLQVDENRRRDVFLEFALAAAMSAGALEDYARELARVHPPKEAYALFRQVCVQRCQGGLPPWAAMADELRSMAAKAGLDKNAEDESVLDELLDAPALAGAAFGFWKAYEKPLIALAHRSPSARGRLLNLHPWPPREAGSFMDWWLKFMESTGAAEALWAPAGTLPKESEPVGGPALWLGKSSSALNKHNWGRGSVAGLMTVLPKMAARLRSDGQPVDLHGTHVHSTSLDLIDLALELRIPLASPGPGYLGLDTWLSGKRSRPLMMLAADEIYGPRLTQALEAYLGRHHADTLIDIPGLRDMVSKWLGACADRFDKGGVIQLEQQLQEVDKFTSPRTFALNIRARDRIAKASAVRALQRSLHGGLIDELGWPALEQARKKLAPGQQGIQMSESWPFLVVTDGAKAIVVGRDNIVLEHDLRLTGHTWGLPSFIYTGAQLLVSWHSRDGLKAYWSGRPAEVFNPQQPPQPMFYGNSVSASFELDDGGRTAGARAVHAGDTKLPAREQMSTDGKGFWRVVHQLKRFRIEEYDPATGRTLGNAWPRFLDEFRKDGYDVDLQRCWLLPFASDGALGPSGVAGFRARTKSGTRSVEVETADGLTFTGTLGGDNLPVALVRMPGDQLARPLGSSWQNLTLYDPSGDVILLGARPGVANPSLAPSTPLVPPWLFWQHFRPRDPSGSAALRNIDESTVKQLLESAVRENSADLPATAHLIKKLIPQVSSPEVAKGVLAAVSVAARVEKGLRTLQSVHGTATEPAAAARAVKVVDDGKLSYALSGLLPGGGGYYGGQQHAGAFAQIRTVADYMGKAVSDPVRQPAIVVALKGGNAWAEMPKSLPSTNVRWNGLAGRMAAVAYRAASPAVTDEQREALLTFIEMWGDTPFATHPEWFRVAVAGQDGGDFVSGAWLKTIEGRHYFYAYTNVDRINKRRTATVLEGTRHGFKVLPAHYPISERPCAGTWEGRDRLLAIVKAIRERGPVPWKAPQVERLCELTGMTAAEAALLLAGLPNLDSHQHNFLEKAQREAIGLKTTEAVAGQHALKSVPNEWRLYLLAAAMPDVLEQLWDPSDPVGERVAAAWLQGFKKRVAIDDELILAVEDVVKGRMTGAEALAMFAQPEVAPALNYDGSWAIKAGTPNFERQPSNTPVFDASTMFTLARLIPWLFLMAPVADPIRQRIPEVIERARQRLKNPHLVIGGAYVAAQVQGRTLRELLPQGASPFIVTDAFTGFVMTHLRPSAITGREDPRVVAMVGERSNYYAVRFLTDGGAEQFAERVRSTPVPAGGFEANPASSVPELLAEIASTLQLTPEAAALYLQVLTLAEPTIKNVVRWNGWTGKQYKTAAEELLAHQLVVSGKRPRAAREIFLPGAWNPLKAPNLPVETWKLALYEDAPIEGRMLILKPVHLLFAQAWSRLRSGDSPRFEEVATSGQK